MLFDLTAVTALDYAGDSGYQLGTATAAVPWIVRKTQVATEDVDALLTAKPIGFVGSTRHRVHPGDSNGNVTVSELRGRSTKPVDKATLFDVTLASVSDDKDDYTADSANDGQ